MPRSVSHRPVQAAHQALLLEVEPPLPAGMTYVESFIDAAEEAALIAHVERLPLRCARYKEYTAQRRTAAFGAVFDFEGNRMVDAPTIPAFLLPLRARVACLAALREDAFVHALVTEYSTGAALGWHRDVGAFAVVAGVSLGSACRMRLRPYPPPSGRNGPRVNLELAPRSAYVLRDEVRWAWEHCVPPTPALRYSITFRTLRAPA